MSEFIWRYPQPTASLEINTGTARQSAALGNVYGKFPHDPLRIQKISRVGISFSGFCDLVRSQLNPLNLTRIH